MCIHSLNIYLLNICQTLFTLVNQMDQKKKKNSCLYGVSILVEGH